MMFKCDKCGICCEHVDFVKSALNRGDGVCRYFDEKTRLCGIYEIRPCLCNVDASYEKYFKNSMSKAEFYAENYKACEALKKTYGKDNEK